MQPRVGWRWVFAGLCATVAGTAAPSLAEACSPAEPPPPIGLPRAGTTGVSTATSIIVFGGGTLTGFTLEAGGENISLDTPVEIGAGADGMRRGTFWRVRPA